MQSLIRPISDVIHQSIRHLLPPTTGLATLDQYIFGWKTEGEYVVAGREAAAVADLALTLALHFAQESGQIIWVGQSADLTDIVERLTFRNAGIEISPTGTAVIDEAARNALTVSRLITSDLPIEFLNIDDCGDLNEEEEFLTAVTSDRPTMIVVEASLLNDANADPVAVLSRRTHLHRMIGELKKSNLDWRILWQVQVNPQTAGDGLPDIDQLCEQDLIARADAVVLANLKEKCWTPAMAELHIVKNKGSTGMLQLEYMPALSTWREALTPSTKNT